MREVGRGRVVQERSLEIAEVSRQLIALNVQEEKQQKNPNLSLRPPGHTSISCPTVFTSFLNCRL